MKEEEEEELLEWENRLIGTARNRERKKETIKPQEVPSIPPSLPPSPKH